MILSKLQIGFASAVVIAISLIAVWEYRETVHLRVELNRQTVAANAQVAVLRRQVEEQSRHANDTEADLTKLMNATQAFMKSAPTQLTDTQDLLNAAVRRVAQLMRAGKPGEALEVYLEAYRELRAKRPGSVESQMLMSRIARMGKVYPAAISALSELRDTALADFQANKSDVNLGIEVALLNERLGEGAQTLALYDALPADSPIRQSFGLIAQDDFVQARRYTDALIGKSYGSMLNQLEMGIRQSSINGGKDATFLHDTIVRSTATNIEVLTGAGNLDQARILTAKLLAFDGSDLAREIVNQHVQRAGQLAIH
jgi:hypothetical protein